MKIKAFNEALHSALETGTEKLWGIGEPPSDTPALPYGVIHTLPGKPPSGSLGSLVDWLELRIQLVSVGGTHEQASWMQQKTLDSIVGDDRVVVSSGGESVTWVELEEVGMVSDSGHSLWQSNDIFRFRIQFG